MSHPPIEPLTEKNLEVREALLSAWREVMRRHWTGESVENMPPTTAWKFYSNIFMMVGSATGMLIASVANDEIHRKWLTEVVTDNIPLGCDSFDQREAAAKRN